MPEGAFDLVHVRLVLLHLPERGRVLDRLVKTLKPGGWLVDEEVGAEARAFMWQRRSAGANLWRANFEQLRGDMIDEGYITNEEIEKDLARLEDMDFLTQSPIMWAAWGRRPPA